ncbi:hypothetical protein JL722_8875 [Aureococcus anophagefferens]|nr:hypothetical protein JL722_8875 [Aureococcus anophagefferens]
MILYSRVHGSSWLDVPPGFVAPDDWPEPAEFGDVAVARGFRVPNADPWPPELAGVDLDRARAAQG